MAAPRGQDKRESLIEAAIQLFGRYGFKRTTVDLLAREAGVAKPTVYAYFADKDAVFRAVVDHVADAILAETERARREGATLEERLGGMLAAKFTRYYELVNASPHAHELIDSQTRLGEEGVKRLDRAFLRLLTEEIEGDRGLRLKARGMSAAGAAGLLVRAASGAAYDATSVAGHRKHVREIVEVLVAGLRSG